MARGKRFSGYDKFNTMLVVPALLVIIGTHVWMLNTGSVWNVTTHVTLNLIAAWVLTYDIFRTTQLQNRC